MASEVRVAETTETVEERLAALEQAVTDLGGQVNEMTDDSVLSAELSVVPGLKLRQPIPILVEEIRGGRGRSLGRAPPCGASGVTSAEAIESLREELCTVWHDLESASRL